MTTEIDYDALLDDVEKSPRREPPKEPEFAESDGLWTWDHLIVLTAITILAGLLRLYRIDEWSFWIDEVHTLRDAVLKTPELFWRSGVSRYPIAFLLLRWIEPWLPGTGEGSYRLLFAFFGICSVPMLAVFLRRMLGMGPALLAALLLALSPWHLYWSQNCRFYTLVLFFALASMSAFHLGVEKGSRWWLLTAIVLAGLAALSHPSAALLVPTYLCYLLVLRTRWIEWPPHLGQRAISWLLLLIAVGAAAGLGFVAFRAFEKYQSAKLSDVSTFHLFNTLAFFIRISIITAAAAGALLLWQRSRRACAYLVSLLALPTAGVGLASLTAQTSAQYLFFSLPVWCALAAYGAWEIARRCEGQPAAVWGARVFALGLLVFDLAAQDHLYFHYRNGERPDWRQAAIYIDRNGSPEDVVASNNEPCMEWYLNPRQPFHLKRSPSGKKRKVIEVLGPWSHKDLEKWVEQADREGHRVWVVITEPTLHLNDPEKKWDRWLRDNLKQALRLPNWTGPKDMTVLVYRYDPVARENHKGG